MERQTHEPTLMDGLTAELGDPRTQAHLERLNQAVPWAKLAQPIQATYQNQGDQGGRPNVPVQMMLKIVMLQKWFNLSDPGAEAMLRDRISFRRFVGLGWTDATPDHSTIAEFRRRLREEGLLAGLFEAVVGHLKELGLLVQEGTLVDATIIEAPRGRRTRDGLGQTTEPAATYTKKHGRTYHGYKAHTAVDRSGLVTDYVYDTAKVHDSRHMDPLIEGQTKAVYADSAYMDQKRSARLQSQGIQDGIVQRRVRGQKQLRAAQQAHNRACAGVRALVEHPYAWLKNTGGFIRARYRGLTRNAIDFGLGVIAYNFKRSLSLMI